MQSIIFKILDYEDKILSIVLIGLEFFSEMLHEKEALQSNIE